MGADSLSRAIAAADYAGCDVSAQQGTLLTMYHDFLATEGSRAGGIGPNEIGRLWDRHIADSLVFCTALTNAEDCLDIGSGIGLPGIPLAIVWPTIEFVLLDRSGRRCDMMRRAVAVLGLENCAVLHRDIKEIESQYDAVVSRAAIPPDRMMIHVKRVLRPGGIGLLGLSRSSSIAYEGLEIAAGLSVSLVRIPSDILDSGANLLRIEAT